MTAVGASAWRETVAAAAAEGYRYFDWLGAVDEIGRSDTLRVVLVLRRLDRAGRSDSTHTLTTQVPRDDARLDSISSVFAGAGWHEREAAELFGIDFEGGQHRRLLLAEGFSGTPLRKDEVLGARAGTQWPGAKEPGESDVSSGSDASDTSSEPSAARSGAPPTRPAGRTAPGRRRMVPPGVPDPQVWGDRDPEQPPAEPGEVADSTQGGRIRRRR
jgi:NADH-quinone oxidoreductase subunit C